MIMDEMSPPMPEPVCRKRKSGEADAFIQDEEPAKVAKLNDDDVDEGLPSEEKVVVETLPSLISEATAPSAVVTDGDATGEVSPSIAEEEVEEEDQFDSGLSLSDAETSEDEEEEEEERDQAEGEGDEGQRVDGEEGEEDEEEDEEVEDGEEDEDEDEEEEEEDFYDEALPPLYNSVFKKGVNVSTPTPPKTLSSPLERGWGASSATTAPAYPTQSSAPPLPSMQKNAFGFLDQSGERIECDENGKSYLQLGTPASHQHHHHHLPVTPVLQPKPGVMYHHHQRRMPLPPATSFPTLSAMRGAGLCDHTDCLRRRDAACYRAMRARMLSQSLHKLHASRQNQEASLRRTVLICNTLRHIEEESEREAVARSQQHHFMFHQQQQQQQQHLQQQPMYRYEPQQQWIQHTQHQATTASYGQPCYTTTTTTSPPPSSSPPSSSEPVMMTPSQFNLSVGCPPASVASSTSPTGTTTAVATGYENDSVEASRHYGSTEADEEKGINWGSVLSLSSQADLDPLNNNCFSTVTSTAAVATANETWQLSATTTAMAAAADQVSNASNPVTSVASTS
jgi:hypothetical protein